MEYKLDESDFVIRESHAFIIRADCFKRKIRSFELVRKINNKLNCLSIPYFWYLKIIVDKTSFAKCKQNGDEY